MTKDVNKKPVSARTSGLASVCHPGALPKTVHLCLMAEEEGYLPGFFHHLVYRTQGDM